MWTSRLNRWLEERRGGIVMIRSFPENELHTILFHEQPVSASLVKKPPESDIRQRAFLLDVAAAYVGVHPSEPDLKDVLLNGILLNGTVRLSDLTTERGGALRGQGVTPKIVLIIGTPLVDRYSMTSSLDDRILRGVQETHRLCDPADGRDGIPQTDETKRYVMREHLLESFVNLQ
jgi:hypothetical protein